MSTYSSEFLEEMKQALLSAKQKLGQDLAGLSSHTEVGPDEDENASEVALDEVSQDLIVRIKSDLEKIDKALEKMEQGTYGVDDQGRVIGEDRLRAIPWADRAIN